MRALLCVFLGSFAALSLLISSGLLSVSVAGCFECLTGTNRTSCRSTLFLCSRVWPLPARPVNKRPLVTFPGYSTQDASEALHNSTSRREDISQVPPVEP